MRDFLKAELAALRDDRAAAPKSMREAFASDPQRFEKFSLAEGDLAGIVAAFEPDHTRDDRAILVLRVSS